MSRYADMTPETLMSPQRESETQDIYMRSIHTTRMVAETIADKTSHGFQKHHDEFNDPRYGSALGIETPEDLQQHAFNVLASRETTTINPRGTTLYAFHEPTETVVILNVYGRQKEDGGTIYRRNAEADGKTGAWYERLVALEAERMGVESFPVVPGGLVGRLMNDDAFASRMEERYSKLYANKKHKEVDQVMAAFGENRVEMLAAKQSAPRPAMNVPPPARKQRPQAQMRGPAP